MLRQFLRSREAVFAEADEAAYRDIVELTAMPSASNGENDKECPEKTMICETPRARRGGLPGTEPDKPQQNPTNPYTPECWVSAKPAVPARGRRVNLRGMSRVTTRP